MAKTDSPPPRGEPARWRSSAPTNQKRKFHSLPSSTPITLGHNILVLPQKCNCSDPVPHTPECRVSLMLSQWNTPTVRPWGVNSTFDLSTDFHWLCGLMSPWEQLVLVLVCLRSRSFIIAPPSVVGWRVLSSDTLLIELPRYDARVVLCCQLCRLCRENHVANLCKPSKEASCPVRGTTIRGPYRVVLGGSHSLRYTWTQGVNKRTHTGMRKWSQSKTAIRPEKRRSWRNQAVRCVVKGVCGGQ